LDSYALLAVSLLYYASLSSSLIEVSLYAGTPNSATEMQMEIGNNRRVPSPLMGLKPLDDLDGYCVIKERMTQALRYFIDVTENNVLAQVWAPIKNGSRYVLTTSGQPFVLGPHSSGLHQYRMLSLAYTFSVDEENDGVVGLPGRVFQQRVPEWTPNVQYYSSREYPRRNHAQNNNVQGSLALPVFEASGQSCVGVLEIIMTSPKINYAPEVDKVCKALEVGLLSPCCACQTSCFIPIWWLPGDDSTLYEILMENVVAYEIVHLEKYW